MKNVWTYLMAQTSFLILMIMILTVLAAKTQNVTIGSIIISVGLIITVFSMIWVDEIVKNKYDNSSQGATLMPCDIARIHEAHMRIERNRKKIINDDGTVYYDPNTPTEFMED